MSRTHMFIPDTQSKPGVPNDHLRWLGQYVLDRRPDVIVHAGDHWDFPSLSAWDKGRKAMEGRRYAEDVEKGNEDFDLIMAPTRKYNAKRICRNPYHPELHLLRGNHEDRLRRAIEENAQLDGALSFDDLESPGWTVHDFLKPVFLDGVGYSHFWANPMSGRPYGGMIETRLKTIGHSFTQGHQQTLQTGIRFIQGPNGQVQQRGLIAGSFYLHSEDYLGYQGNAHWRGVILKHEVHDGGYDILEASMDFLCRKYEGVPLSEFMAQNYPQYVGR